jgi:hypothetical protein
MEVIEQNGKYYIGPYDGQAEAQKEAAAQPSATASTGHAVNADDEPAPKQTWEERFDNLLHIFRHHSGSASVPADAEPVPVVVSKGNLAHANEAGSGLHSLENTQLTEEQEKAAQDEAAKAQQEQEAKQKEAAEADEAAKQDAAKTTTDETAPVAEEAK